MIIYGYEERKDNVFFLKIKNSWGKINELYSTIGIQHVGGLLTAELNSNFVSVFNNISFVLPKNFKIEDTPNTFYPPLRGGKKKTIKKRRKTNKNKQQRIYKKNK
jgi:hypothetical protein